MGKTYLYLMASKGAIKIGITWNLRLRLTEHRRKDRNLALMGYVPFDSKWVARDAESIIHKSLGGGGRKTEWYRFDQCIIAQFMSDPGVVACQ